jgi:hypothetical protein
VVYKDLRRVLAASTLPESKSINHNDVCGSNDGISGTVGKLVPAVRRADLDALRKLRLDSLDLAL